MATARPSGGHAEKGLRPVSYSASLIEHYRSCWVSQGHPVDLKQSTIGTGPLHELPDAFSVVEFPPEKHPFWIYATTCMSRAEDIHPVELHIFSRIEPVELLVASAHYHQTCEKIGLWHTVNFGKSWIGASRCRYGLISLPYSDGPSLQQFRAGDREVQCLWMIPITQSEREYKIKNGIDSLGQKFEESQFDYLDPMRESVV